MEKLDYKKAYKDLYAPGTEPVKILVPNMTFIQVPGKGDPNTPGGEYKTAVELLYALTYTIKMNKSGAPASYFEYVVPPLEGLWWFSDDVHDIKRKDHYCWVSMIRQPEFFTQEVFAWACSEMVKKKPDVDVSKARLCDFEEGLCVQCMHLGPYDSEPVTVEKMDAFMRKQGLVEDFSDTRSHHEIYLSDPRKVSPAKMKTVLRHPVKYS